MGNNFSLEKADIDRQLSTDFLSHHIQGVSKKFSMEFRGNVLRNSLIIYKKLQLSRLCRNKGENIHRFALSTLRGKLLQIQRQKERDRQRERQRDRQREKREKKREKEKERKTERKRERQRKKKRVTERKKASSKFKP